MNSKSIDMQGGARVPVATDANGSSVMPGASFDSEAAVTPVDAEALGSPVAPGIPVVPGDSAAPAGAVASEANGGEIFDVAVIGAGPAGLTAGLYAARAGLHTAVFEQLSPGGQLAQTERIENYPGFSEGAGGFELAWSMKEQAERFGVQIINEEVSSLGVSYCATCDGSFFRGKTVMVVGGGNTAAADAIYLSRLAERIILVHRRDKLRATPVYHEQLTKLENVSFMWNTEVRALRGEEGKLVSAQVEHLGDGALETVPVDGVFVAVGTQPNTELLAGALPLDAGGYIAASETGETSIPGVFAAGDVRAKVLRQVVTAVSDGAVCAEQAANHVAI